MKLNTENKELLQFNTEELQIQILGGIKLSSLDRLRVTLKLSGKEIFPLRYNLDLYHTDQVEKLIRRTSEYFELELKEVRNLFMGLIEELETYRLEALESTQPNKPTEVTAEERKVAISYLKRPKLLQQLLIDISKASEVIAEEEKALLLYIILSSKKLKHPLSTIIYGESGTGKTTLMQGIANLLPPEDVVTFTSISNTSLYYMDDLTNKSLLIEDLSGANNDEVLFALRELASNQKLTRNTTQRNHKGDIVSKTVTLKTRVSIASCTTANNIYLDNENRSIPIHIDAYDKNREQKIVEYKKLKAAGLINQSEIDHLKILIRNAHSVLQDVVVINPFASQLELPESVKSPKRSFQLYLNFIETVAYIHQYQRKVKTDKKTGIRTIEVTKDDILWSNRLLKDALLNKSDDLSNATRNFYELLKEHLMVLETKVFTIKDIKKLSHIANIGRYLKELRTYHYIRIVSGNRYRGFEYKLIDEVENWKQLQKQLEEALSNQLVVTH